MCPNSCEHARTSVGELTILGALQATTQNEKSLKVPLIKYTEDVRLQRTFAQEQVEFVDTLKPKVRVARVGPTKSAQ